ncbi:MAG: hypothetical protein II576_05830 [Prevotella sp.]|nr:hypothetical protein [Prevotella sp.]MBQ5507487.1 hypothetical protein [Prevotella sp.]MBR6936097.1 hypothetical protein [Prevotella sp.]
MKKFFTLFVAALLSGNVFAQSQWTDYVVNGDFEGDDTSCFWSHDWADDNINQGPIRVVEDPTQPGNHVAIVSTRDLFEDEGSLDSWTFQFFVTLPNVVIEEGDELRLTMRIRADKAADSETQAHNTPGDYNYWNMYGNIGFTTEWQTVVKEALIGANQAHSEGGGKEMHTVAFNLYVLKEANNYYFDDVKLEIRKAEAPHELTGWLEMVRNGIDSNDMTQFANGTFTTFTGRDGVPGIDQPARIVNDPLDGQPALEVKSVAASYMKENLDEEGNVQSTTPMYIVREGNQNADHQVGDSIELTNWQSQFFVTGPHVFRAGQKIRFVIEARAEHPTDIETQIHRGPGDYLHYQLFGNLSLTEEWQRWEFEQDVTSEQNGGSTVAFNLNVYKDADNTYYFRNIELSCNDADATLEERTLGSEDIVLPIPAKDQETTVNFDMSNAVSALLVPDFKEFLLESNMKTQMEEGALSEEEVSIGQDGAAIDENGNAVADGGVLSFDVDPDASENNNAVITVANLGKEFTPEESISTSICFVQKGWYYIYNIKFVDNAIYNNIANITKANENGTIYDLTGRKVINPTKGIYIMNGKKFIQK